MDKLEYLPFTISVTISIIIIRKNEKSSTLLATTLSLEFPTKRFGDPSRSLDSIQIKYLPVLYPICNRRTTE